MALPSVGGGYQNNDGNVNEIVISELADPLTASVTATLSVAQITGGLLVANPSTSAASYTLPTVALTEAVLTNAKIGSIFELSIVNLGTSAGAVTIVAGTGWTLVGNAVIAVTTSSLWLARKTDVGAWTLYRQC